MKQRSIFSVQLGKNLRAGLHDAGVSSMQAAIELGLNQFSVQRHLRGDVQPSLEAMTVYARLTGKTVDALLPRLDSNQQPAGYKLARAS